MTTTPRPGRLLPGRRLLSTVALLVGVAGLAACGDDEATAEPASVRTADNGDVFNDADVRFATDMIPHHAQAIEMVTLADARDLDPQVVEIATGIREAQAPEVETMVDWLTAWDEEVPETSLDHANAGHGGEHGGGEDGGGGGMMTAEDMTALAEAPDAEFQDLWLEMMIEHHRGAIEMASAEQDEGQFADAVALAESIEASQTAEVERLEVLLGS